MNLKGQHLGRLLTLLAGLIILFHAVVPHHHHFELTHSPSHEITCENTYQKNNNENPDTHCQAFNILVSGRVTNSSLNISLLGYFSFLLPGTIANIEIPPVKNLITSFFGHQAICLEQFFFTTQSLRAPPANA